MAAVKEEAAKLVHALPDDATRDDLMYEMYVRQAIDAGLADSESGDVASLEDMRKELGRGAGVAGERFRPGLQAGFTSADG